jgi:broad specificity phosphatase PhoE
MPKLRYLTHPQVRIDPAVPVPRWGLSEAGRARVEGFKIAKCLSETGVIVSSGETKALETAAIIAHSLGIAIHVREDAHENDRSTTGYLPPSEFESVADRFFASPEVSIRGWERACDAQSRIVCVFRHFAKKSDDHDLLMVGHGGVGTLLFCALSKVPIARVHDQPPGGGNLFCFDLKSQHMDHGWRTLNDFA